MSNPPMVRPSDFLDEVEAFLEGRGHKLEQRTRFDPVAYLAYMIGVEADQYEEFVQVLRNAAVDTACRLDIVFSSYSGNLTYIGIKATVQPEDWGVKPTPKTPAELKEAASEAELALQRAEEALAKFYLAGFEIAQLKKRCEQLSEEAGEARAEAQAQRRRADEAEATVKAQKTELQRLAYVKVTDETVKHLQSELANAARQRTALEATETELRRQLSVVRASYEQYKATRESHICEVAGLRLLKETSCKCLVLVDHRRCTGIMHLSVTSDTKAHFAEGTHLPFRDDEDITEEQFKAWVAKNLTKESLHLEWDSKPPTGRVRPGRFMRIDSKRSLIRALQQFAQDATPEQRGQSTYVVRRIGDM